MTQDEPRPALRRDGLDPDPVAQFLRWLEEAGRAGVPCPAAMTLATASGRGQPSARVVLLRGIDQRGFVFFTNYESRKGRDLEENPSAALVFYWQPLSRQVRVEGRVEPLDAGESDAYFAQRPRGHQVEAHASPQSRVLEGRAVLERAFEEAGRRFAGRDVPRPPHWGGYRVVPEVVEFWQEGEHRLHDRLRYRRGAGEGWVIERLAP